MSAMVGVPPFTVVESDTADGETYCGLRAAAEVDSGIVSTTFPATSVVDGTAAAPLDAPPPPHPLNANAQTTTGPTRRTSTTY
jgi:hypothetical protein